MNWAPDTGLDNLEARGFGRLLEPGNGMSNTSLVRRLIDDQLYREALTATLQLVARQGIDGLHETLALASAINGRRGTAIELLKGEVDRRPEDKGLLYRLASCLAVDHRFDAADALFSRELDIATGVGELTNTNIVRLLAKSIEEPSLFSVDDLRWRQVELDLAARGDLRSVEAIYFLSCDSRYAKLFAKAAIASVAANGDATFGIHLHLINPDPECRELIGELVRMSNIPIAISQEQVVLSAAAYGEAKAYYASARFLLLPQLLDMYNIPVLSADTDQLVVRSLSPLLSAMAACDAGLLFQPAEVMNFFGLFSASAMIVRPTAEGGRFARRVCSYIVEQITRSGNTLHWHLDQVALAVAVLRSADLRWYAIPERLLQSDVGGENPTHSIAPETVFWSITLSHPENASKLRSDLFRSYSERHGSIATATADRGRLHV